jgi:hypothetical protein
MTMPSELDGEMKPAGFLEDIFSFSNRLFGITPSSVQEAENEQGHVAEPVTEVEDNYIPTKDGDNAENDVLMDSSSLGEIRGKLDMPTLKSDEAAQQASGSTGKGKSLMGLLSFRSGESGGGGGGGGLLSFRPKGTKTTLSDAVSTLLSSHSHSDDKVVEAGKVLSDSLQTMDKVSLAAKVGALDAVAAALSHKATQLSVSQHLLLPLINLSAGEDEAGLQRTRHLVARGCVQHVSAIIEVVLSMSPPEQTDASTDDDDVNVALIAKRCVWTLQHLCRRDDVSANGWLPVVQQSKLVLAVCALMATFPSDGILQQRACSFCAAASFAIALEENFRSPGLPGAAAWSARHCIADGDGIAIIDAATAVLRRPISAEDGMEGGILSCIRHEAAATALADVGRVSSADVGKANLPAYAVRIGTIDALTTAMEEYFDVFALQECGLAALVALGETASDAADDATRLDIARAGASRVLVRSIFSPAVDLSREAEVRAAACQGLLALSAVRARDHLVLEADALEALVEALARHPKSSSVVVSACRTMAALCSGHDPSDARKCRALDVGCIRAVVSALRKQSRNAEVVEAGCQALTVLCFDSGARADALASGAEPQWLARCFSGSPSKKREFQQSL